MKKVAARVWKAYLPVSELPLTRRPSRADVEWFRQRGIGREALTGALAVMRRVRVDVLPLARRLRALGCLESLSFLVHDRASGVPTREGDDRAYVDATVTFRYEVDARKILSKKWRFVRPFPATTEVAGVRSSAFRRGVVDAFDVVEAQSAWYLGLVDGHVRGASDVEVLKHVGQFLHLFANMSRLAVA